MSTRKTPGWQEAETYHSSQKHLVQIALNQRHQCFHLLQSKAFSIFKYLPQSTYCLFQRSRMKRQSASQTEIYHFQTNENEHFIQTLLHGSNASSAFPSRTEICIPTNTDTCAHPSKLQEALYTVVLGKSYFYIF